MIVLETADTKFLTDNGSQAQFSERETDKDQV